MELKTIKLGDVLNITDTRNDKLDVSLLLGVSNEKKMIPSIANINGTDLKSYKILKKNQFVYVPTTSRNGDKISIALLTDVEKCIVSSSYTTFEILDESIILPEYLMLLFNSTEFDRYARYNSWGTAREVFSWEDFCNLKINVPPINEQQKIINQFSKINKRKNLLNTTNEMLHNLAYCFFSEIIMGKTENATLGDLIIENKKSQIKVSEAKGDSFPFFTSGEAILKDNTELSDGLNLYLNTGGRFGIHYYSGKASYSTDVWCIKGKNEYTNFLYFYILYHKDIIGSDQCFRGSALKHLKKDDMKKIPIYLPTENELQLFKRKTDEIMRLYTINQKEIECLEKLEHLLICKM